MKLTALEIRKHEFARGFRGYNPEEVDAFLQMVAQQYQQLIDDYKNLEQKYEERSVQLDQFRREEQAMRELLQTARDGAQRRLDEAQMEADRVLEDADGRAGHRLDDAERRAIEIVRSAEKERQLTRRETARIAVRQSEIVARLRAFLVSEMEVLQRYEADEAGYRAADGMTEEEQDALGTTPQAEGSARYATTAGAAATARYHTSATAGAVGGAVAGIAAANPASVAPDTPEDSAAGESEWDEDADLEGADGSTSESGPGNGPDEAGEEIADLKQNALEQAELNEIEIEPEPEEEEIGLEEADAPVEQVKKADHPVASGSEATERKQDAMDPSEPKQQTPEPIRLRRKAQPARQGDLMDDADGDDASGATEEIRKIRRILEDLDR